MAVQLPKPPGLPFIGNAFDIDPANLSRSFMDLADRYGPVYELRLPSGNVVVVCGHAIYNELCDEKRFTKGINLGLAELRHAVHDGLFTAEKGELNWEIAHRILVPAFGPLSVTHMFDEMHDILSQLVLKWARYGPEDRIDLCDDFTRLTLDSIALAAMATRFNSFYKQELHPFVGAMKRTMAEAGRRAARPALLKPFMRGSEKQYFDDIETLRSITLDMIAKRKSNPIDKKDFLNAMLHGVDRRTGRKMTDESIVDNMITFLVAGHETTSGLLSFLFFRLIDNPNVLKRAQQEVDSVVGRGPIKLEHLNQLPYLTACVRESLRLNPPAPGATIEPLPQTKTGPITIGGGKYLINPDAKFRIELCKIHIDPAVYGDDAEVYRPERMLDEEFKKLPKNAWKPFGNGVRSCIGRGFAWQEAMLAATMLLQVFDFRNHDPNYTLAINQAVTIKPKDLYIHVILREGIDSLHLEKLISASSVEGAKGMEPQIKESAEESTKLLAVFFGGNMGTCENLAQIVAHSCPGHGFKAEIQPLDDAAHSLPKDRPVLIITSTYEGEPPNNAGQFLKWVKGVGKKSLEGVRYAVFGCGNRDWKDTFQRIPKAVHTAMEKGGATAFAAQGIADVADNDVFNDFEKWEDAVFWPAIRQAFGGGNPVNNLDGEALKLEIATTVRSSHLRQDVKDAVVVKNEVLTVGQDAPKHHVEIRLPPGMEYRAGDYLAVLPMNPLVTVRRVVKHFGLPWDAIITVKSRETSLPSGTPLSVFDLLSSYVELAQPATERNLKTIISVTHDETAKKALESLSGDAFSQEVKSKRISVLDLLEAYPSASLPFADFLSMLPQLRLRQYSISSSPLADPTLCSLTLGLLDQAALQDAAGKRFLGVASTFLCNLHPGDHIPVTVKASHPSFHLPDIGYMPYTPLIMIAAGTGIAPFRAFVQERARLREAGHEMAPALLFVGCRHPDRDVLYKAEFADWARSGAVDVRYAYSRPDDMAEAMYVQDRFWEDRWEVMRLFRARAKIFVCGHGKVVEGVKKKIVGMLAEVGVELGAEQTQAEADAEELVAKYRNERFMFDVFD